MLVVELVVVVHRLSLSRRMEGVYKHRPVSVSARASEATPGYFEGAESIGVVATRRISSDRTSSVNASGSEGQEKEPRANLEGSDGEDRRG